MKIGSKNRRKCLVLCYNRPGMTFFTLFMLVCLSALGFSFALPNEFYHAGFPLGGFFCLFPFFFTLQKTNSRLKAAFLGFVFGFIFHAASSWWLANFKDYAVWTLGATSVFYGLFYGFWGIVLQYSNTANRRLRPFIITLLWTVLEWQKSSGYFAFPWGLLPYTVQSIPVLIQIADIGGIYGLSFILALSNGVLAEIFAKRDRHYGDTHFSGNTQNGDRHFFTRPFLPGMAALLLLLAWTTGYGIWHLKNPSPVSKKIPLVLVQHNTDQYYFPEEALRAAVRLSKEGTAYLEAQGKKPALIVWSETVLTRPYAGNSYFSGGKEIPFFEESGIPVLTGAPVIIEETAIANGAILVRQGEIIADYKKVKLIPFAETIPFGNTAWMKNLMERFAGFSSEWTAGKKAAVMEIPGLRFGTPICFEDAFAPLCGDFVREGAEVLINLTNDSWSHSVSAEAQHLAAARFRSVENRRTLVRSTNSGYTVVIDAEGRTIAELPLFTAAFLAIDIPVQRAPPTVHLLLGDWFPLLSGIVLVLWLIRHLLPFTGNKTARN